MPPNEPYTVDTATGEYAPPAASVPAWKVAAAGLAEAYAAPAPPKAETPDGPGRAENRFPGFDPLPGPYAVPELTRRKPGGLFEAPVVLADGQVWYLPKPRVRITPADGDAGYRTALCVRGEDGYQALMDAVSDAEDLPRGPDRSAAMFTAEMAAAKALVTKNYTLTGPELAAVVQFGLDPDDDPEGFALREAVLNVAYGIGPKRPGGTAG